MAVVLQVGETVNPAAENQKHLRQSYLEQVKGKQRSWIDQRVLNKVGLYFDGKASINAETYDWSLGDGFTTDQEEFFYTYDEIGTYDIDLIINNGEGDPELTADGAVKILPEVNLPWLPDSDQYGGGFESNSEQWGVDTKSGTGWERGQSSFGFKDGTKTGEFAFVIAPEQQFYEGNSESYLYLPDFDMTEDAAARLGDD